MPFQSREEWARTSKRLLEELLAAIDRGAEQGIQEALTTLLRLPSETLTDPGSSRGRARRTRGRLRRFDERGHLDTPNISTQRCRTGPEQAARKRAARVHHLLTLGSVTRAAKSLEAVPIADPTEDTIAKLRELHPSAPPPPAQNPTAAAMEVTMDTFRDALRSLPKGSSAGPSGWTYEHIKAATQTDVIACDAALRFVNAIIGGKLPHLPELLDSTLIGLEKPGSGGGIRPIAIGEVWLRLAGLCAMASCPGAGQALAPLQLGVGVRGGSQIIGHAISSGIAADPDCVTLQLDWRNAFNSISRSAMLEAIAKRQPTMLPFATWAYRQPSRLIVSGAPAGTPPIMSERGVRQGDPCGPLFFALTTQDQLEQVALLHPDVTPLAYADDTFLQGSAASVIEAFPAIRSLGAAVGLDMRLDKCAVYSSNLQAAADTAAALVVQHRTDGLMAAGSPIGTDDFVAAHANKKAETVCGIIDDLMGLPLPAQDQFILLKNSMQMRLAHLPRIAPWSLVGDAIQLVENKTSQAAFQIMQRPEQAELRTGQLTLPLRLGGMGLRMTSELEGQASFLAAAAITETAMREGPQQFRPFAGPKAPGLTQVWESLHAEGVEAELWTQEALTVDEACIDNVLPSAQRLFSRFTAERRSSALLASFADDGVEGLRNIARLRSCSCRAASMWVDVLPTSRALQLTNGEFISSMRHRCGQTHMPANVPGVQCFCGRYMEPGNTDHAMTCKTLSGALTLRHEILKEIWRRIARRAGIATSVEPVLRLLRGAQAALIADREGSRGDILLALSGALTVADVSVVHPAAETYVQVAAREEGGAAAIRDQQKRTKYSTADPHGYAFIPLSMETFGRLGKPAMQLLNTLAETAADGGVSKEGFVTNALHELSIGLCRGNAVLYKRSLTAMARVSGAAFQRGMLVPSGEIP